MVAQTNWPRPVLTNPKPGRVVRIHYGPKYRDLVEPDLQDRIATVVIPGRGRPRNHLVRLNTMRHRLVVVPAGNLTGAP